MKVWFFVIGIFLCVLALLVYGTVMNWPTHAITAARVGLFLFAAANAFMGLLTRFL